jgi:two-component sensor histidine kinase
MPILDLRPSSVASGSAPDRPSALLPDGLFDALPVGIYTCTPEGAIVRYNRRAAELWGQSPPAGDPHLQFCGAFRAYRPDGSLLPPAQSPMAEVLSGGRAIRDREIILERPGGSRIVVLATLEPIRDGDGRLVGSVGCLHDISGLKQGQALLLAELNHRVKNALTSVQSLASQTIRGGRGIDDIRADFEARLFALNGAHTRLANSGWGSVDLHALLHDVLGPYQNDDGTRIVLGGEAASLPPKTAVALTMIVHELTTNAAKYGALSAAAGAVSVSWRFDDQEDGRHIEIDWLERDGPAVLRPATRGFGSRLIERAVVHELKGIAHVSYDVDGVRCVMDFPVRDAGDRVRRTA